MHEGHIYEPAEENPELALRHFGRALELLRVGDRDRAKKALELALEYDPDFAEAQSRLKELVGTSDQEA